VWFGGGAGWACFFARFGAALCVCVGVCVGGGGACAYVCLCVCVLQYVVKCICTN